MKQKKLLREIYRASLDNDKSRQKRLHQQEIARILEKRKAGKTCFSAKWHVTDES